VSVTVKVALGRYNM